MYMQVLHYSIDRKKILNVFNTHQHLKFTVIKVIYDAHILPP